MPKIYDKKAWLEQKELTKNFVLNNSTKTKTYKLSPLAAIK